MIKIAVNFKDENAAQVRSKQSGEFFFSLLIFPLTHCMVLLGRNAYKQCGRGSQSIPPGTRPLLWNVWVDPDCHKCLFIRLCKRTSHIQWELIKIWSGRASERGIRRSEVRFLMGTQNFLSLFHSRDKTQNIFLYLKFMSVTRHYCFQYCKKELVNPRFKKVNFLQNWKFYKHYLKKKRTDDKHDFGRGTRGKRKYINFILKENENIKIHLIAMDVLLSNQRVNVVSLIRDTKWLNTS